MIWRKTRSGRNQNDVTTYRNEISYESLFEWPVESNLILSLSQDIIETAALSEIIEESLLVWIWENSPKHVHVLMCEPSYLQQNPIPR